MARKTKPATRKSGSKAPDEKKVREMQARLLAHAAEWFKPIFSKPSKAKRKAAGAR